MSLVLEDILMKNCCVEYLRFSCLCSPLGLLWCHDSYVCKSFIHLEFIFVYGVGWWSSLGILAASPNCPGDESEKHRLVQNCNGGSKWSRRPTSLPVLGKGFPKGNWWPHWSSIWESQPQDRQKWRTTFDSLCYSQFEPRFLSSATKRLPNNISTSQGPRSRQMLGPQQWTR